MKQHPYHLSGILHDYSDMVSSTARGMSPVGVSTGDHIMWTRNSVDAEYNVDYGIVYMKMEKL